MADVGLAQADKHQLGNWGASSFPCGHAAGVHPCWHFSRSCVQLRAYVSAPIQAIERLRFAGLREKQCVATCRHRGNKSYPCNKALLHSLSIVLVALQHRPWSLAELCAPPGSQGDGLRQEGGLLVPVTGSFQPHLTTLSCSGQR